MLRGGCTTTHATSDFFELSPETPQHRAAQTRYFETDNPTELLSASAAVLQDLGKEILRISVLKDGTVTRYVRKIRGEFKPPR